MESFGIITFHVLPRQRKQHQNLIKDVDIDNDSFKHIEALIYSMTPYERSNPKIINHSRKKRIATGCGLDISKINKLLKQFKMMSDMMKKMSKGKGIPSGNIPDEILNQLK